MKTKLIFLMSLLLPAVGCTDPDSTATKLLTEAKALHDKAMDEEGEAREALLEQVGHLLSEAAAKAPRSLEARIALIRFTWDQGKQVEAVRAADGLALEFPSLPEIWILRGDLHDRLSQWTQARDAYLKARQLGGEDKALALRLGTIHGKLEDYEAAFDAFDRAARLGADKAVVYYNVGLCYEGCGSDELAMDSYLEAYEEDSDYQPVQSRLANLYQKEVGEEASDMNKALVFAERAYEAAPDNIQVLADLADLLLARKEYDSVLSILEKALAKKPGDHQLLKYKTYVDRLMRDGENSGQGR